MKRLPVEEIDEIIERGCYEKKSTNPKESLRSFASQIMDKIFRRKKRPIPNKVPKVSNEPRHELWKTADKNKPEQILDRNGEVVLSCCKRCGKAEVELFGPCVTKYSESEHLKKMAKLQQELILSGLSTGLGGGRLGQADWPLNISQAYGRYVTSGLGDITIAPMGVEVITREPFGYWFEFNNDTGAFTTDKTIAGQIKSYLEEDETCVELFTNPPADVIVKMKNALQIIRLELWRLLDAKGVDPKSIREWPEIVTADAAIKAVEESGL